VKCGAARQERKVMNKEPFPVSFESFDKRTESVRDEHIRHNADYYTVTFRKDMKNHTFVYSTLELARINALVAAKKLQRPVLIYGVCCPYDDPSGLSGYQSWIETAYPSKTPIKQ
jgi:hypothetical protein